jgi:hypothetical protein
MTQSEKEQWGKLFGLADRIWRLSPWGWCRPGECFGIWPVGRDEPCIAIFCEGVDTKTRIIRYALGWQAFFDFLTRAQSQTKPVATWMLEIPMLELLYLNGRMLFAQEKVLLDSLKRPFDSDKNDVPVFRSIKPGYHPWLPDAVERVTLEQLLYQTYGMILRLEEQPDLLLGERGKLLILRQGSDGLWKDEWVAPPRFEEEGVEIRLKAELLEKLKRQPLKPVTIQLNLQFMPILVGVELKRPSGTPGADHPEVVPVPAAEAPRPSTAYMLIAVDVKSGDVFYEGLLHATEGIAKMWGEVPERILELFDQIGGCPEAIEVSGERMTNLLRSLEVYLPFKMVLRERLKLLDAVADQLSRKLLKRMSDGPEKG